MFAKTFAACAVLAITLFTSSPYAQGQPKNPAARSIFQQAELTGSDTQYLSSLGYAVAVSGNTVVVGSPGGSDGEGNWAPGAVYAYVKPANGWGNMTQVAKLTPSDQTGADSFGTSVAISGDTIVANSNYPEVYVYEKPSTGWTDMTETAILTATSVANAPCLCGQLGISGNTIIVGSPLDTQNYGSIEVYSKPATGWQSSSSPNAVLMQPTPVFEDQSFRSVSIDGKVVVGEGLVQSSGGGAEYHVYLFREPANGWNGVDTTPVVLSSTQSLNYFGGGQVAVSGNTVVATSPLNFGNFPPTFVDVWIQPSKGWSNMTETAQLSDGATTSNDQFGTAVAASEAQIVVGAPSAIPLQDGHGVRGAAYVFIKPSSGWHTTSSYNLRLLDSNFTKDDGFGSSVAMRDQTIIVGAPGGPNHKDMGAGYIFQQ